jgi:hypothetical protein
VTQLIKTIRENQFIRLSLVFTCFSEYYSLPCETVTVTALFSEDLDVDGRTLKFIISSRMWIGLL